MCCLRLLQSVCSILQQRTPPAVLRRPGTALFAVIAVQVILSACQSLLNAYVNGRLTLSLRSYLFTLICRKRYSQISRYHSGDILNRLTSDVDVGCIKLGLDYTERCFNRCKNNGGHRRNDFYESDNRGGDIGFGNYRFPQ